MHLLSLLQRVWAENDAQDIAEYALMLAVILIIVITTVTAIGENAQTIFSRVADALAPDGGGGGTP